MLLLAITIVNVALPEIQSDLGASLSSLQWVVDAYALTLAAFLLAASPIGDRVGRTRVFSAGCGDLHRRLVRLRDRRRIRPCSTSPDAFRIVSRHGDSDLHRTIVAVSRTEIIVEQWMTRRTLRVIAGASAAPTGAAV
jgi:hypothetical protein